MASEKDLTMLYQLSAKNPSMVQAEALARGVYGDGYMTHHVQRCLEHLEVSRGDGWALAKLPSGAEASLGRWRQKKHAAGIVSFFPA
jgi:hypothetical protein